MSLVKIKNLYFDYGGAKILFDINLTVGENERIVMFGSNGAGKSTLLKLLGGLHIVKEFKEFDVLGQRIPHDLCNGLAYLGNRWERSISFCGTSPYVADIKAGEMMKNWQEEYKERRDELVEILDIDLNWRMHTVSDGQRKKIQIMLGLLAPFKLVIIDEFLNDLDVVVRDRFFNYLVKECETRKASIIYATHIFDNLDKWMNKIIYINQGKCSTLMDLKEFNKSRNLFESVKDVLVKEKVSKEGVRKKADNSGYTSGRIKFQKL